MHLLRTLSATLFGVAGLLAQEPGAALNQVSERPFDARRVVSPSGRHYAVLTARRGYWPGPFELRRRRDGAEPLDAQRVDWLRAELRGDLGAAGIDPLQSLVDVRDEQLVEQILPQLPVAAFVFDEPLGLLLFDHHAEVGYGRIFAWLDAEGRERWSHDLDQLFGSEPSGAWLTRNSRVWCDGFGVDHEAGFAWVVSLSHLFRVVDLRSGRVAAPDAETLLRICSSGAEAARIAALDALARREAGVPAELAGPLAEIAGDAGKSLSECLRAAVAARRAGAGDDFRELFEEAIGSRRAAAAVYAASHLHVVAADADPLPGLAKALRVLEGELDPRPLAWRFEADPHRTADLRAAFEVVSEGRSALRRWASAPAASPALVRRAEILRWMLGGTGLAPRMRSMLLGEAAQSDVRPAFDALLRAAPADLREQLVGLLEAGSADDPRIAEWFLEHPSAAAVRALEAARSRLPAESDAGEVFLAALEACRGA